MHAIEPATAPTNRPMTISLCGDVVTGRGIDQILAHPGDPTLHETFVKDAREYVKLAESAHGPIARPVGDAYVWGDALEWWEREAADARIVNLETSLTASDDYWRGKAVHYRMHPANVACLAAARLDCCCLANNHVLDWGRAGLAETLQTLKSAGLSFAGAGANRQEAAAPAVIDVGEKGRVIVFSFGSETSGIPLAWAAKTDRAGVNLLADFSDREVRRIAADVAKVKRPGDVVVASIHWGLNWGYHVPAAHCTFAHRLIDVAGVDVIHGHSSHHVLGIEVYRGRLMLYGCGDFLDDYEGISGHEAFRGDLGLMYFAGVDPATGELVSLRMAPTQVRRMSVRRACAADSTWLADLLNRESRPYGVRVVPTADGTLAVDRG